MRYHWVISNDSALQVIDCVLACGNPSLQVDRQKTQDVAEERSPDLYSNDREPRCGSRNWTCEEMLERGRLTSGTLC